MRETGESRTPDLDETGGDAGAEIDPLDDPWPPFLAPNMDPALAQAQLWAFICRLLAVAPPGNLRALPEEDRKEIPGTIFWHLVEDGFRRLRSYRNQGYPFAHWLMKTSRHVVATVLRRVIRDRDRRADIEVADPDRPEVGWSQLLDPHSVSPEEQAYLTRFVEKTMELLQQLSSKCQLLLWVSIEHPSAKDIAALLGGSGGNIQVSDD